MWILHFPSLTLPSNHSRHINICNWIHFTLESTMLICLFIVCPNSIRPLGWQGFTWSYWTVALEATQGICQTHRWWAMAFAFLRLLSRKVWSGRPAHWKVPSRDVTLQWTHLPYGFGALRDVLRVGTRHQLEWVPAQERRWRECPRLFIEDGIAPRNLQRSWNDNSAFPQIWSRFGFLSFFLSVFRYFKISRKDPLPTDPYIKDANGDDALTTASLNGHEDIFQHLIDNVVYSPERIADAYQLFATVYLEDEITMQCAIKYLRKALKFRAKHNLVKHCTVTRNAAFQNAIEFSTEKDLDSLQADDLRMQCLLISERILGATHKVTIERIDKQGRFF